MRFDKYLFSELVCAYQVFDDHHIFLFHQRKKKSILINYVTQNKAMSWQNS